VGLYVYTGATLITAHHLLTRVPATEAEAEAADLIEYKKKRRKID